MILAYDTTHLENNTEDISIEKPQHSTQHIHYLDDINKNIQQMESLEQIWDLSRL